MKKANPLSDSAEVTSHIKKLDPAVARIVQAIRKIILATDHTIGERIKWNNPSFYYTGVMRHAWRQCELQLDCKKFTIALTNGDAENRIE